MCRIQYTVVNNPGKVYLIYMITIEDDSDELFFIDSIFNFLKENLITHIYEYFIASKYSNVKTKTTWSSW